MQLQIHIDGGSRGNPGPAGCGVVVADTDGNALFEAGYFLGRMTNNAAEYHGLIRGLEAAGRIGGTALTICADSELMVRQINGQYRVKNRGLRPLYERAMAALGHFESWKIAHVYREANARADELANLAMDTGADVVERDLGASPAPRRKKHTRAPTASDAPAGFEVECTTAPTRSVCPAPCQRGRRYAMEGCAPGDMCLYAAAAVLPLVAAGLFADGDEVRCEQKGCGARFKMMRRS